MANIQKSLPTDGRKIKVFVNSPYSSRTFTFGVRDSYTVAQVMAITAIKDNLDPNRIRAVCQGRQLDFYRRLSDYGITNGSRIHLVERQCGGGYSPSNVFDAEEGTVINTSQPLGERGVVCFGSKTDQTFSDYHGFEASKKFEIKPFTIELRMKSKYSLD